MKYIPIKDTPDDKGRAILEGVLKHPGRAGATLEEMRRRSRIWDALDANADPCGLLLEDADAAVLVQLYRDFPFGVATRELLKHVEAVVNCEAPSAVTLPKRNGQHAEVALENGAGEN